MKKQTRHLALWGWLIMGIWAGIVTYEVNVNRINIIFYPLIMFCGYGIYTVWNWCNLHRKHFVSIVFTTYAICSLCFFASYGTSFSKDITRYFNTDFLAIVKEADHLEDYDTLYITDNMDWQYNPSMAEILTQYSCRIDARYYQELTNETGGRILLPYSQRYHFINMEECKFTDTNALYVMHKNELSNLESYTILHENDTFVILHLQ